MTEYTIHNEDGIYTWTTTEETETGPEETTYCTNDEGRGIWQNGKQILGTSQFNLSGCAPATRARRVAKFMA